MNCHLQSSSVLLIGVLLSGSVFADSDAEREALARLLHEVVALEVIINEAESNADPDTRVRFRYDWLRQDLEYIKKGIRSHMDAPQAQPRSFPPLRGDYRR